MRRATNRASRHRTCADASLQQPPCGEYAPNRGIAIPVGQDTTSTTSTTRPARGWSGSGTATPSDGGRGRARAYPVLPIPSFRHEGHRLAYTVRGSGPRVVVLLPGLLFSQRMHAPLANALAERDNRVITMDLLGHGRSDRPKDMWEYSMTTFGEEVVALLDHLDIDEAVVGGTSLGANTTLEVAALAPERLRGMVVEMPVLDNALLGCAIAFTPLMVALTFGEPVMKGVQRLARAVPENRVPWFANVALDMMR